MRPSVYQELGRQLRKARRARGFTQPDLAMRVGRDRARISSLERDMLNERTGRDRLTLFAEICEALDLVPVLTPRAKLEAVFSVLDGKAQTHTVGREVVSAYDELFVALNDEDED